uniref:Uncharacterized protein n=1 Tax=Pristionchus pacificus TaxID=54126 RepID=A0A2A6CIJ1_PRIPA|eukprot:PDM77910.1 hypothetical protein PRIPAC_34777 [Pristionchus pacificus]
MERDAFDLAGYFNYLFTDQIREVRCQETSEKEEAWGYGRELGVLTEGSILGNGGGGVYVALLY